MRNGKSQVPNPMYYDLIYNYHNYSENFDIDKYLSETSYYLWEAAGKPEGQSEYFWQEAQKQLYLRVFGLTEETQGMDTVAERIK